MNKDDVIPFEKIEKGFFHLGITFNESQLETVLNPFLKTFLIPKIEVNPTNEYHFRDLMGIFFIMSKSSQEEKACALYKLYDYSNNNSLSKNEIEYMFNRILLKVDEYTKDISEQNDIKIFGKMIDGNEKMIVKFYL